MAGASGPTSLELLGQTAIPAESRDASVPLGGLSALTLEERTGTYLALSDDRSENGPARFYRLRITLPAEGRGAPVVGIEDATTLSRRAARFPPRARSEGIALAASGSPFLGGEAGGWEPFVQEFDLRAVPARAAAAQALPAAGGRRRGVRDNLGVPGFTGRPLPFSGVENGLAGEPGAGTGVASLSRLLRWDLERGGAPAEFLYRVEAVSLTPPAPTDVIINGLVELIALDRDRLLALERQWVPGVGVEIKLYAVSVAGLADVAKIDAPASLRLPTAQKTLL
jgi:hypothetical protein